MARYELSNRAKWQGKSGESGGAAEMMFSVIMGTHLEKSEFQIVEKPKDLEEVYNTGVRNRKGKPSGKHGVRLDFKITNMQTRRSVFVEMKRQKAGRGNAHERACKFFTPGMLLAGRRAGKIEASQIPFWLIFSNGIAKDPKRIEEIKFWFKGFPSVYLLWENLKDKKPVIEHFEKYIKPLLSDPNIHDMSETEDFREGNV